MFPIAPEAGTASLPLGAQFWAPTSDEIDENGLGYCHDTWLIKDLPVAEARAILATERRMAMVVAGLAVDAVAFERLAGVAECNAVDDPAEDLTDDERRALGEFGSESSAIGGLELGVAGLVHALATVRIIPAASCRSHPERSWSDAPVVLFAATEFRARALEPLVKAAGCTFSLDGVRPGLLVVRGRSIEHTMALAEAVLANRATFVRKRGTRSRKGVQVTQEALF